MEEGLALKGYKKDIGQIEMVYWADIVHDKPLNIHEKSSDSTYFVNEPYVKAPGDFEPEKHDLRTKFMSYLNRKFNKMVLNDDLSLNFSFIGDFVLKHYFKELELYYSDTDSLKKGSQVNVRGEVRERLHKVLKKHKKDRIMLIAHSMGSIVAYDVLTFLATDVPIHSFITIGAPLGSPLVISKIADEHHLHQETIKTLHTPPGIYGQWINLADITDKVAFNYKLGDHYMQNNHQVSPQDILVENNYIIDGKPNPHKSFGYLRVPELSEKVYAFINDEKYGTIKIWWKNFLRKWRYMRYLAFRAWHKVVRG